MMGWVLGALMVAACAYVLFWRRDPALERYVEAMDKLKAAKRDS